MSLCLWDPQNQTKATVLVFDYTVYFDRTRTGSNTNMASRELRKKRGAVTPSPARKTIQKESEIFSVALYFMPDFQ